MLLTQVFKAILSKIIYLLSYIRCLIAAIALYFQYYQYCYLNLLIDTIIGKTKGLKYSHNFVKLFSLHLNWCNYMFN